jgi:hypothetical protein
VTEEVCAAPCHNPEFGLFQYRLKSLVERLALETVFYSEVRSRFRVSGLGFRV